VQAAFIRAELDPTKANLSGSALEMAKTAETLFASAWTTLGKSDLQEGLEKSANRLLGQAKVYVGKANVNVPGGWEPGTIQAMRDHWVSRGEADALNLAESSAARSWHVDDRNPDVSLVPGGDDIAYADSYVIFDGDGEAV